MSSQPVIRCAVYTRKSTEEGLEQEFNSLDAQREACEAYIASQAGLGWRLIPSRYDDGGISGGTMDRPALQLLLEDIRQRRVDVVVVYKIDRLTRSLTDFAKIVEVFDAGEASFVSVTQAFNTTTSMGRLTLNVLLSFAQFEREVTAERIRDKIAASKRKGMWMGGVVPLGYRVENRKLLVAEEEADLVRHIFARYLELGSVRMLAIEMQAKQMEVRRPAPRKASSGSYRTGPFARGNLFHMLSNPIYIGRIRHHRDLFEGEHEAIIDSDLFQRVQEALATKAPPRKASTNHADIHLLTGIAFDEEGDRLAPTHTTTNGRRLRYYVSQRAIGRGKADAPNATGWRLRAERLDGLVEKELLDLLRSGNRIAGVARAGAIIQDHLRILEGARELADRWTSMLPAERKDLVARLIRRVELRTGSIHIEFGLDAIRQSLGIRTGELKPEGDGVLVVERQWTLRQRGVEMRLVITDVSRAPEAERDTALVDMIVRANSYLADLNNGRGRSLAEVAKCHGTQPSEVSRLLPLAFLSPRIVEAVLAGRQPDHLTPMMLSRLNPLPVDWREQEAILLGGVVRKHGVHHPDTHDLAST